MNNKWLDALLFLTTTATGFYGGMGFFTAIGGNPAIARLSEPSFAEYWQSIDFYMAARMPVFGPMMLLLAIISAIVLLRQGFRVPGLLAFAAAAVLIGDVVFTLNVNHPHNQLIQSWDLQNLPDNVNEVKQKVVAAFFIRKFFMMASFLLFLLSVWMKHAQQYKNLLSVNNLR